MEKTKTVGIIIVILLIGSLALIIISLVWAFPVMTNSGKDEPSERFEIASKPTGSDEKCIEYLEKFTNEEIGVYEAFDFKMKNIHKYSLGLVCLLIIQPCIFLLLVIIFAIINNIYFNGKCGDSFYRLIDSWKYLSYVLVILFFVLLEVNYNKSKNKEFEDFSKCSFIDSDKFSETYDNIFKVIKNMRKLIITFPVYIALFVIDVLLKEFCFKKSEDNEVYSD